MTMRRTGRWVLFGVAGLVGLLVLFRIGVGLYLHSSAGREIVAERLQAMIGLPVEVSSVDLGSTNSTLKFRVLDPKLDKSNPAAAVLSVESATADVSLTQIVTGRANPRE